jgi:hypothetical protein
MKNGECRMLCFALLCFIRCAFDCISQPSPDLPRQLNFKQAQVCLPACLAPASSCLPLPLHVGTPSPQLVRLDQQIKICTCKYSMVIDNLFPGDLIAAFLFSVRVFVSILGSLLSSSSFNGGGWWTMAGETLN